MVIKAWLATIGRFVLMAAVWSTAGTSAWAQAPAAPPPAGMDAVEVDPLHCWWRTTVAAVRIGDTFSLVLTCGVLENATFKVVPDQSTLEPAAIQLPPFELIGGTHGADLRTDERRFFQYEYTLRVVDDLLFDEDVKLTPITVTYRVQTRMAQRASIEGQERTYVLPSHSIRVLSLVPSDALDIRDAATETFADIDGRSFRANALIVTGGVLFTLSALVALVALVRLFRLYHVKTPVAQRLVPDAVILRGVNRELSTVRREREAAGWTPDLAGRALAACRIVAGYALSRPNSQVAAAAHSSGDVGTLMLHSGWLGRKRVLVAGTVTAQHVAQELAKMPTNGLAGVARTQRLEALQNALAQLTSARYGRQDALEETALDESLGSSLDLVRRLKFEHAWLVKKLTSVIPKATELGRLGWSR